MGLGLTPARDTSQGTGGREVQTETIGQLPGARSMVRLEHITKRYPGATSPAVSDLSLDIGEGEIFTLLGPSGCGKTTTLRVVAGLETPDEGSIYFVDQPIVVMSRRRIVPPNKRNIGMVFQSYAIWPHMTVAENVADPLRLRKLPARETRERVERALAMVGLSSYENRPAPELSGGQQQRVALARALVYEPAVLLLDEPFSNLDSKLRELMRVEVKLIQSRLKVTVLFVTHDQIEALSLSSRIAVMNFGRVQQVGTPRELYDRPANTFVRDFLGRTALLRGVVQGVDLDGHVAVVLDGPSGNHVRGRSATPQDLARGMPVYLAMRPEDAELRPTGDGPATEGYVDGVVEAALFVGDRTEYRVAIQGQGSIMIYGRRDDVYAEGQAVRLQFPPSHVSIWRANAG